MDSEPHDRRRLMAGIFDAALDEACSAPAGYEDLEEIDCGGMAMVYRARQLEPLRDVALKVILPKFAQDVQIRERFQREGRAMAALEHPGILPVYQVGNWDGMAFISMKLADGGSLQSHLKQQRPTARQAVQWLIEVGEAVHFAHQRGVLHRDLKPGNLLFDSDGSLYVGDFGVAKLDFSRDGGLTQTEAFVGTPHYLAPEIASGSASGGSVASDLYGLGAVLYECLTGRRPYDGAENLAAQLRAVADDDFTPVRKLEPTVPRDVAVICEKSLAKRPEDRYRSVAAFVEDLKRWQSGRDILARPAGLVEKVWRWSWRHPLPASLAALFLLTLTVGLGLLVESYQRRGELLHESLIERAKSQHLERRPGLRKRALGYLSQANEIRSSDRIREEAIATLAYWDVSEEKSVRDLSGLSNRVKEVQGGVEVSRGDSEWFLPGGVLRCEAVSSNGQFLAMVRGDDMEISLYCLLRKKKFASLPLERWPESLGFTPGRECLRVGFSSGESRLLDLRGKVLLDGFDGEKNLAEPIGFSVWSEQSMIPEEADPYGGQICQNETFLVTTSAIGLHIWDIEKRLAVDFYEVENQRIDAPTDAWWLDSGRLLVQVPGEQEILLVGSDGQITGKADHRRMPGTKVRDVLRSGDWLVEVMNEDDDTYYELWTNGDQETAQVFEAGVHSIPLASSDDRVEVGGLRLRLPNGRKVQTVFPLERLNRVVVLTKDYHVCDWDLDVLNEAMKELGFQE